LDHHRFLINKNSILLTGMIQVCFHNNNNKNSNSYFLLINLVSTPKSSAVPPTPESLGGTGKGTAGDGPPTDRENTHFTT